MNNNYIVIGDSIAYGIGDFKSGGWSSMLKNYIVNKDDSKLCNNYVHIAGFPGATSVDIIGTDALEYLTVREFDTLCIPICSYIGGKTYIRVYPVKALLEGKWLSLEGSFAYAHDSRYSSALCEYPVPIFDRCEPF